jgi:hypothetical protein
MKGACRHQRLVRSQGELAEVPSDLTDLGSAFEPAIQERRNNMPPLFILVVDTQ